MEKITLDLNYLTFLATLTSFNYGWGVLRWVGGLDYLVRCLPSRPNHLRNIVCTLQKKSMLWVSTTVLQHLKFNFFWKISDIYETKKYILVWFTFKSKREKASSSSFYNKPIDDDVVKADGKIGNSVAFRFNLSHVQFRNVCVCAVYCSCTYSVD